MGEYVDAGQTKMWVAGWVCKMMIGDEEEVG